MGNPARQPLARAAAARRRPLPAGEIAVAPGPYAPPVSGTAARPLRQLFDPCRERVDNGLGLLRNKRVAGVGNDGDTDPISELVFHFVARGFRLERILCGLQIEQRRGSAGPPFALADSRGGGALSVADFGMPAGEPDRRIVARRKKREP